MSLTYWEPRSLSEAVAKLSELEDSARLLAGGTDLMVQFGRGQVELEHVINISALPELHGIEVQEVDGRCEIVIGAMSPHRLLERSPLLQGPYAALPLACESVGGIQTRNMGTIGGNLCNASPAADTPPVLLALDAKVRLVGPDGSRSMAMEQFLLGRRKTALRAGELLASIHLPVLGSDSASHFLKLGQRSVMEIATVNVAARVTLAADGQTCAAVRIGLGSVAPMSIRARAAEQLLVGKVPTESLLAQAGKLAAEATSPISDLRASAEYRVQMVEVLTRRTLHECLRQLQGANRTATREGGGR